MSNSIKTQEDLALVQRIIGVPPLDFARLAGDELAIILPDGRKLLLTPSQVDLALTSGEYCQNVTPPAGGVARAKKRLLDLICRVQCLKGGVSKPDRGLGFEIPAWF